MPQTRISSREIGDNEVKLIDIQDLSITDLKIALANKDGAAGTPSMRTLGSGSLQAVAGDDFRLSNARTPTNHTHGNITNTGLIGTVAGLPLITGTGGLVQVSSFGTSALTFAQGNDSRINNGQTAFNSLGNYLPLTGGNLSGNLNASGTRLITNFVIDTHPESATTVIPFIHNDIAYLRLRGGTATDNFGNANNNLFDGSPSYISFNNTDWATSQPDGYVLEAVFHKTEVFDVSTNAYRTVLETSTNNSQIVQVSANGPAPSYAISKMRMTFNDFNIYSGSGFRLAQIWLLNYSSQGAKETLLGRDGGTLYGNLTAPTFIGNLTGNVTGNVQGNLFGGVPLIYSTALGTAYNQTIQIREKGLNGQQGQSMGAAPRLAFHWSGQVASSIAMEANGRIAIMNNPGTGYESLIARDIVSSGGSFSGAGTGLTGTAANLTVGTANKAPFLSINNQLIFGASGLNYFNQSGPSGNVATTNNTPIDNWFHILRMNHANNGGYYADLAVGLNTSEIHYRRITNGVANGWFRLIDSLNIGSQSVLYADTAGTATPNNDSNLVHKTGDETIFNVKNFADKVRIKNEIFGQGGSSAALQVNGFQRTGNIYLHAGGNTPDDSRTGDVISNEAGVLTWTGVGTGKVLTAGNFVAGTNYQTPLSNLAFTNVNNNFSVAQTFGSSVTATSFIGRATKSTLIEFDDGPRNLSNRLPNTFNRTVAFDFVTAGTANGTGNYGGVMSFTPWEGTTGSTGDSSYQLAFANKTGVNASGQPKLSIRNGIDTTWNAWYELIHSGNIDSQTVANATNMLPLAGGTVNGRVSMYVGDSSGTFSTRSIELREVGLVTNTQSSPNYAPSIGFHWGGLAQTQIALLSNGVLTIRNDAGNGNEIIHAGNILAQTVNLANLANLVVSNPNRTDSTSYPVTWSNGNANSPIYSCNTVRIQSNIGEIAANSFRKNGGVGTEFLMADGTVTSGINNSSLLLKAYRITSTNWQLNRTGLVFLGQDLQFLQVIGTTAQLVCKVANNGYLVGAKASILNGQYPIDSGRTPGQGICIQGESSNGAIYFSVAEVLTLAVKQSGSGFNNSYFAAQPSQWDIEFITTFYN